MAAIALIAVIAPGVAPLTAPAAAPRPAAGTVTSLTYGHGATAHPYLVYTPRGWTQRQRLPLLVMVHGCQTTAAEQLAANLYDPLADRQHFIVAYPDTDAIENAQPGPLVRCWQFFDTPDLTRAQGDGAAVAGITRAVTRAWHVDRQRVYLMGMSAGSFLTADMAATYPDLYAAVGENAGGAYGDPHCILGNTATVPASMLAEAAYRAMGPRKRVMPKLVIGGDADHAVPPACADKALAQTLRTDNLVLDGSQTRPIALTPRSVTRHRVPGGRSYTVSDYVDRHGCLIGQRYLVHGMGHFWSGGSKRRQLAGFTDPTGPSAAVASWSFFARFTLGNTGDACAA